MNNETRINHFLKELEYLSKKYNLYIKGCSCCGSPYLEDEKETLLAFDLIYNDKDKKYYYKDFESNKSELIRKIWK